MGTTIAVPAAILPLPFAFSQLGWAPAIIALLLGTVTTYYASMLLAGLFSWNGEKYYRYRDLVRSIFGESSFLLAIPPFKCQAGSSSMHLLVRKLQLTAFA